MSKSHRLSSPCYCGNLRKASRALTHIYNAEISQCGIPNTQYTLLSHLRRLGPVTLHSLSEAMLLERTTLVRNLQLLVDQNLVEIQKDPPRPNIIRLTDKGLQIHNAGQPYWENAQSIVLEQLTGEERAVLDRVIQKLIALTP